jgi:RimJ/RimL family protein N-acetyltransferase
MSSNNPVLHTQRLTIRPATPDDVEATWRFRRLPEVDEWLGARAENVDQYRELLLDPVRLEHTLIMQLGHEPDGEVIGDLMLRVGDPWAQADVADQARGVQAELGWVLDPAFAGQGYATEAVRELIRHCFEDLGLRRVKAGCFLDNQPSWRLMERVGMRREEHAVQDSLHRSRGWLDGLTYALLADEWRALRKEPSLPR